MLAWWDAATEMFSADYQTTRYYQHLCRISLGLCVCASAKRCKECTEHEEDLVLTLWLSDISLRTIQRHAKVTCKGPMQNLSTESTVIDPKSKFFPRPWWRWLLAAAKSSLRWPRDIYIKQTPCINTKLGENSRPSNTFKITKPDCSFGHWDWHNQIHGENSLQDVGSAPVYQCDLDIFVNAQEITP